MKDTKDIGYYKYNFECDKKIYSESFVNSVKEKKIVTIYENGKTELSIERSLLGKNDSRVGHTEFMKDSLAHREEVYMLPFINKFSKNDYCLAKQFEKNS